MITIPVPNCKGEIIGNIYPEKKEFRSFVKDSEKHIYHNLNGIGFDAKNIGLLQYYKVESLYFYIRYSWFGVLKVYYIKMQDFLDHSMPVNYDDYRQDGTIMKYSKQFICPLKFMSEVKPL